MPKDDSIKKVLVIGSGPIVIGQAAEFDYSGTQACKALKEEGICVVLLNPNPATIMTDSDMADRVYLEPLTINSVIDVIDKEKPDSLIATMGGQAGLNLAVQLDELGILNKYSIRLLGTQVEAIKKGEDREHFRKAMISLGQPIPLSMVVSDQSQISQVLDEVGLPCVVRPAYTLGGTGGGHAGTKEELADMIKKGLDASPIHEVLVESSLYGQKEIEFEIVRDSAGNAIAVCSMENIDPMGIHTGDSLVVAPALTLSDKEYKLLRKASLDIVEGLEIQGACNVQLALKPDGSEYYIIEVNPRVSRSSALASKATGYPIARVATKIALGYYLDEIGNEVTGKTSACHEPAIDYVTLKIPRWPWDKFSRGKRELGLQMKSTGEVMAIGRSFEEALGKGISSLDQGKELWSLADENTMSKESIIEKLNLPDDTRLMWIFRAVRSGITSQEISLATGIDRFFVDRIAGVVEIEEEIRKLASELDKPLPGMDVLRRAKKAGLSDKRIAGLTRMPESRVRQLRESYNIKPVFKTVDTCAGEFGVQTPYYYSSYDELDEAHKEKDDSAWKSVVVLGSGPIRIGQGIEFDYCAVHGAWSLEKEGYDSVIINNNPETVSTDFNTASRLYFEPLDFEHVMSVIEREMPLGVCVGFGGQTAINLVDSLNKAGVNIIGTNAEAIDITSDRGKFTRLLHDLGIPRIPGAAVYSKEEAINAAKIIGYPLVVRPSYVLGGRAMAIVNNHDEMEDYLNEAVAASEGHAILIDKYIMAREVEVDVVSDGVHSYVPAILEHIERSGVHSGDSIAQIPPEGLSPAAKSKVIEYTQLLCRALNMKGIANIQYIIDGETVYCLEVNPRASRTVPFVTKVTGFPLIRIATGLSLGRTLSSYGITCPYGPEPILCAVKMPVFSWAKIPGVDPVVGPEMKSTGEVMGFGTTMDEAMMKAFIAQGVHYKGDSGSVLMTIADRDKKESLKIAGLLKDGGWKIFATHGTAQYLSIHGIEAELVRKIGENSVSDRGFSMERVLLDGYVDVVINMFTKGGKEERDGFKIRSLASQKNIQVFTCMETALALGKSVSKKLVLKTVALQDIPKPFKI